MAPPSAPSVVPASRDRPGVSQWNFGGRKTAGLGLLPSQPPTSRQGRRNDRPQTTIETGWFTDRPASRHPRCGAAAMLTARNERMQGKPSPATFMRRPRTCHVETFIENALPCLPPPPPVPTPVMAELPPPKPIHEDFSRLRMTWPDAPAFLNRTPQQQATVNGVLQLEGEPVAVVCEAATPPCNTVAHSHQSERRPPEYQREHNRQPESQVRANDKFSWEKLGWAAPTSSGLAGPLTGVDPFPPKATISDAQAALIRIKLDHRRQLVDETLHDLRVMDSVVHCACNPCLDRSDVCRLLPFGCYVSDSCLQKALSHSVNQGVLPPVCRDLPAEHASESIPITILAVAGCNPRHMDVYSSFLQACNSENNSSCPSCSVASTGVGLDSIQHVCNSRKCQLSFCSNCRTRWHPGMTCIEAHHAWQTATPAVYLKPSKLHERERGGGRKSLVQPATGIMCEHCGEEQSPLDMYRLDKQHIICKTCAIAWLVGKLSSVEARAGKTLRCSFVNAHGVSCKTELTPFHPLVISLGKQNNEFAVLLRDWRRRWQ